MRMNNEEQVSGVAPPEPESDFCFQIFKSFRSGVAPPEPMRLTEVISLPSSIVPSFVVNDAKCADNAAMLR